MSKKLPLEIQRNYSINDKGKHWELKCLACDSGFKLEKPGKGEKIHGGNILHLLNHAASHPTEQEAEESVGVATDDVVPQSTTQPKSQPKPHVAPLPPTVEVKVEQPVSTKHMIPTTKNPNPYKVVVDGGVVTVANFRDPTYSKYKQVERNGNAYSMCLYASNPKHASIVGERLIREYISNNK